MAPQKSTDIKKVKKLLEAQRKELLQRVESTEEDRKPVELDQAQVGRLSRMDAMQVQEMALEQERRREIELQKIDAALARIKEGDYGFCTHCGDDISPKRLEFDLAVPLCVDCAAG
ncbi:MAG: TraR/DksA family transcriptional regulator [Rhodospirillaceae bacterium]|jgi:DnaK suppressor protein|nr:TraR/DksA family transcriptional regulator [Rhodospirillaceae bacterium]MBT4939575.1 TraR/DksA family transcriptional regulator [Rhodospirillaceae bacterium]MBT5939410.1 TraR/DksA family transcriptional regulator [Rhodospirillaceae bacterium]MBT7268871.1 TraR/DksA family transcriptional regulator [Rhodospirillaceae bacterium]